MLPRLLAVTFEAHAPPTVARFWAALLARKIIEDAGTALLPDEDAQLGLRFAPTSSDKVGLNRMHLHQTSFSPEEQKQTVTTALGLGARHLDVGQRPEGRHVVLADPEGNESCVLGPGNTFLEGCGFLAELACDGTREVGLFWSEALGWPLVWDPNEETAIQSPRGGTKIAWGGPPVARKLGRNRQRLELTSADGDHAGAAERLLALGAARLRVRANGAIELDDPDGNKFSVTIGRPQE